MFNDEENLIIKCRNFSKKHRLFYHVTDIIIWLLVSMYITLMITIFNSNTLDRFYAASLNLIFVGLEIIFLNPDKTSNLTTYGIIIRMVLILIGLESISYLVKRIDLFCCYLIIQGELYGVFYFSSYSQEKLSNILHEIEIDFEVKSNDENKSYIEKIDELLKDRVQYRNSIFKLLWALLSVIIFPGIIGLMSIYSEEIKDWMENWWSIVIFVLVVTIACFRFLLTRTCFELIKISQFAFVPERRILTLTRDLLKRAKK